VRPNYLGKGFTATEQRSAGPTFEINGLTSVIRVRQQDDCSGLGFRQDHVPAGAGSGSGACRKIVVAHLKKICPPTVRLEIEAGHGAEAYLVSRPVRMRRRRWGLAVGVWLRTHLMREGDPSDRQSVQEDPQGGFAAVGPGPAG